MNSDRRRPLCSILLPRHRLGAIGASSAPAALRPVATVAVAIAIALAPFPSAHARTESAVAVGDGWIAGPASLHYRVDALGAAPVIFLHEMGTSLASWDEVVPLIARGHRVIRYDIRGFGLSEKIGTPITMAQEIDDLTAVIDRLAPDRPVTLVGSALGGAIALHFAAAHPDRVVAILAIGPAAYPDARLEAAAAAERIATTPIDTYLNGAMDVIYPPALRTPARLARFKGIQRATDMKSLSATSRMVAETASAPVLPRITAPSWIVATTLFKGRPPATIAGLATAIPYGRFVPLATGHLAAIESPELTAELINRFLVKTNRAHR